MEHALLVLSKEPFIGFFPQDLLNWLNEERTDKQIAEAYAAIEDHSSALRIFSAGNDPWAEQAYQDWMEVEEAIRKIITTRMEQRNIPASGRKGTHYIIEPFMKMQGYEDHNGNWSK